MSGDLTPTEKRTILDHLSQKSGADFDKAIDEIASNFAPQGVTRKSLVTMYLEEQGIRPMSLGGRL